MGIIKLLDENTINKIAAGEVVEKPSSIVKELVENSIDAGSNEVTVEVKNGGIAFIRIKDNGKGISSEDIDSAFMRHATSKISTDADLGRVATLGFRGEALASIAAVSRIEMVSKTRQSPIGTKISIEGGNVTELVECGCPDGTITTVQDVFFNTPARLKFLKTESREGMYITDIMQNLAMSHSDVSFKYILNDKLIFVTRGDGDLKSVIHSIYGKEIVKNVLDVNCSRDFISVKGYIGNGNLSKGNRNYQSIFLNGRYIKNKTITAAVEAAYKSMLTINKFPLFILHLYVSPEFVDINVHPTKAEVKFQDDQLVFKAVYHCVKDTLASISRIPEIEEDKKDFLANIPRVSQIGFQQIQSRINYNDSIDESSIKDNAIKESNEQPDISGNNRIESRNVDYRSFKDERGHLDNWIVNREPSVSQDTPAVHNTTSKVPKFGPLAVLGQLHFTYIVAEGPDDMYIIDQHAAHERIYYERYLEAYKNSGIQSQTLIVPIVLEFSVSEKQKIISNIDEFKLLGYEIEDFGGNSIALRCVPVIYGNPDPKTLFNEILGQTELKEKEILFSIDKIMYTMACKSAIKANDKLGSREMIELIEQLRVCDNPFNCPHGRPTIIKMSYFELEKKFKRIQ